MKKIVVSLSVLILFLVLTQSARNQDNNVAGKRMSDTRAGLKLSVEVDKRSYRLSETPRVKAKLQNIGETEILLLDKVGWSGVSGFSLALQDYSGNQLSRTFIDDAFIKRSFAREDFVSLSSGEIQQKDRGLDLRAQGVRKPGTYKLIVWYRSPVFQDQVPTGLKVWTAENGVLVSKPVKITVVE